MLVERIKRSEAQNKQRAHYREEAKHLRRAETDYHYDEVYAAVLRVMYRFGILILAQIVTLSLAMCGVTSATKEFQPSPDLESIKRFRDRVCDVGTVKVNAGVLEREIIRHPDVVHVDRKLRSFHLYMQI